jgi:hypothetical protein
MGGVCKRRDSSWGLSEITPMSTLVLVDCELVLLLLMLGELGVVVEDLWRLHRIVC